MVVRLPPGPISPDLQDHCSQLLPDHPASLVWEKHKQHLEPEAVRIPQSGRLKQGSSGESTGMPAPQSSCSIEAPASSSPHHFEAPAFSSPHHFKAPASSSPHHFEAPAFSSPHHFEAIASRSPHHFEAPASRNPHHFEAPASRSPLHFEAPASSSPHHFEAPASSSPHHFEAPASSSPHHFEAPASSSPHLLTKNCVMPMKSEESPVICNEEPRRELGCEESPVVCNEEPRRPLRCPQESTVSIAASSSWTVSALIQYLHDAVLPLLPPASSGSSAVSATACVPATEYGGWKYPPHLIRYWYQGLSPSEDRSRNNMLRKRKYGDASGRGADYRQGCDSSVRMMSTSAADHDHDHDEGVHMKAGCVDGHVHELGLDNTVTRLGHAVEAAAIAHISQDVMANRCRVSKEEIVLDVPRQLLAKEGSVTEGLSVTAKGLPGMGPRPLRDGSCNGCKSREGGALVNTSGGFISPDTEVRYEEWSDWLDYTMGQVLEVLGGRAEGRGVEAGEEWKCNFCDFRAKEQNKDQGVLRENNSKAIMCTWKSTSCS
ncbi:hypothetical protein CEUSTIGMA_g4699.t1 [Chlamydomonas eustigma]|uniref:Uncharacterized protein n=1 Tax=Chlamydomonas eustigma TaxID=1157962 RepID=A0A250X2D8_9CHLO|nr:hypothetical protein CEUSTIGMA_g4699.t1 [Chlamydomonas eustigma]|eukprot:GAX77253.1 hypothetical protein CEUSTIGMA_g4699.t1 [Chlamydomonas eustigma]